MRKLYHGRLALEGGVVTQGTGFRMLAEPECRDDRAIPANGYRLVMNSWARVAVVVALMVQRSVPSVPTIGEPDVVARLNVTDIAMIKERANDSCPTLWLLQAFRSQVPNSQYVAAYCAAAAAQHGAVFLRRGSYVGVINFPERPWAVSNRGQYAQVTNTQTPDEVPAVRDIRRPFRVSGSFTDVELISLVAYVRSSPSGPRPLGKRDERVEGGWPLSGVWKKDDGSVDVGLAEDDMAAQVVKLRRVNERWEIVSIGFVIA